MAVSILGGRGHAGAGRHVPHRGSSLGGSKAVVVAEGAARNSIVSENGLGAKQKDRANDGGGLHDANIVANL